MALRHLRQFLDSFLWGLSGFSFLMIPIVATLWWCFPRVDFMSLKQGPPPAAWSHRRERMEAAEAEGKALRVRFHYVPSTAISTDLKLAVLVGEDASFFSHGPVDYDAIQEALEQWWVGKRLRGASTITQQLAKNMFLSSERSWWRKAEEVRLAWWLERKLSKHRIFELYLNIVELGPGIFGVDAASRHYFDVTAAEVNHEQAANIAATIPGPLRSSPRNRTRAWNYRRTIIESKMQSLAYLKNVVDMHPVQDLRVED